MAGRAIDIVALAAPRQKLRIDGGRFGRLAGASEITLRHCTLRQWLRLGAVGKQPGARISAVAVLLCHRLISACCKRQKRNTDQNAADHGCRTSVTATAPAASRR